MVKSSLGFIFVYTIQIAMPLKKQNLLPYFIYIAVFFLLNSCRLQFSERELVEHPLSVESDDISNEQYDYYLDELDSAFVLQPDDLEIYDTLLVEFLEELAYTTGDYKCNIPTRAGKEEVSNTIMKILQIENFEFQNSVSPEFSIQPRVFFKTEIKSMDKEFIKIYNESVSQNNRLPKGNNYGLILEMAYSVTKTDLQVCMVIRSHLKRRGVDAHWSDYPGVYSSNYFGQHFAQLISNDLITSYPVKI